MSKTVLLTLLLLSVTLPACGKKDKLSEEDSAVMKLMGADYMSSDSMGKPVMNGDDHASDGNH